MQENIQGVVPMISYENGEEALAWLSRVFGFKEKFRMVGENGAISHAEMDTGSGLIMLASPSPDYECPLRHREHCIRAGKWHEVPYVIDGVLVYVSHIQTHFEKAKAEGAGILTSLEYGGPGTRYRCEDLEGHRWMFMEWT